MKKFLRFLSVLILIAIAGILILGLIEPKEVVVTRTTMIKAPKAIVFEQIQYFKNWPNWDPWYKMDSAKMKITYSGTDGSEGSSFHWEGGDKTGAGDMKNMGITGTLMNYQVDFTTYNFSSQGIFKADDTAGMTKVTWNITVKKSFPFNAAFLAINFDKMLGGDFENGLANMKQYVESHAAASDITIMEVDYAGHIFEGIRKTVSMVDIGKLFADADPLLAKEAAAKINGASTGLFFKWDTTNKTADAMAAFPVSDSTAQVEGATFIVIPTTRAYMAVQKGGYSTSMKYHTALMKYMQAKGQTHSVAVEEYVVSPQDEPDSNKWVTNIYYIIK